MNKDLFALVDLDGNVIVTGNDKQELEDLNSAAIDQLLNDAREFHKVFKGERADFHGISDTTEAGQCFMRMMAHAGEREDWKVVENV